MDDKLLTSAEVAEQLRVSTATLSRWRDRGGGPVWIELGEKMPRYNADDVKMWTEERRRA